MRTFLHTKLHKCTCTHTYRTYRHACIWTVQNIERHFGKWRPLGQSCISNVNAPRWPWTVVHGQLFIVFSWIKHHYFEQACNVSAINASLLVSPCRTKAIWTRPPLISLSLGCRTSLYCTIFLGVLKIRAYTRSEYWQVAYSFLSPAHPSPSTHPFMFLQQDRITF